MPGKAHKEHFERLRASAAKVDTSPVDYFLSAGLDYKGQTQSGYTMNGGGLSGNIGFNPGAVVGLQAQVGVDAAVTRIQETLLVVQRGPREINNGGRVDYSIETPVILNCFTGVQWEGAVGVNGSFGVNYTLSTSDRSSGTYTVTGQDDSTNSDCEIAAIGIELNAGLTASARYAYTNLYAHDPAPLWFGPISESRKELVETLETILEVGTTKAKLKMEVVSFINLHAKHFGGAIQYETWTGHTSTATMLKRLRVGIGAIETKRHESPRSVTRAERDIRDQARNLVAKLGAWSGEAQPNGMCFLRLTSHNPSGAAAIEASAVVKGSVAGAASGSVEVKATLAGVAASAKFAAMRYQTQLSPETPIYCTQDTTIRYSQFTFEAVKVSAKAEGTVLGKKVVEVGGEKAAWDKVINRMSYKSAITYWTAPELLPVPAKGEVADREETHPVGILWGSGLAFGESCVIENLFKLAREGYDPVMEQFSGERPQKYAAAVAKSLHIPVPKLMAFLQDPDVISILHSLYTQGGEHPLKPKVDIAHSARISPNARREAQREQQEAFNEQLETGGGANVEKWRKRAVLIETSFIMDAGSLTVPVKLVRKKRTVGRFGSRKTVYDSLAALGSGPEISKVYEASRNFKEGTGLQCIRLRYRIQDSSVEDRARFSLGIKLAGNGGGISLLSVERAGSEGIVDLATVWLRSNGEVDRGDSLAKYEGTGVPAVTLFCQ